MANTAVGAIKITSYVYGGPGEPRHHTENVGVPVPDIIISEVVSADPKYADGVRSKITYRQDTQTVFFTNELYDALVAQANGNVSAS